VTFAVYEILLYAKEASLEYERPALPKPKKVK